jgi:hypothetical protein
VIENGGRSGERREGKEAKVGGEIDGLGEEAAGRGAGGDDEEEVG